MLLKYLITSLVFLCATCCPEDDYDCAAVSCLGSATVLIEVLAEGKNVFENEIYTLEDITIESETANNLELHLFENEDSKTLLLLQNPNWELGSNTYTLNFLNSASIIVQIDIFASGNLGCCENTPLLDGLGINGESQNINTSFYTVSLD